MHVFKSYTMILLTLVALLAPTAAHASQPYAEYVCSVIFRPGASGFGNKGYVRVTLDDAPTCIGQRPAITFCSEGATDPSCQTQYSESQIAALFRSLQHASAVKQRVIVYTTSPTFADFAVFLAN